MGHLASTNEGVRALYFERLPRGRVHKNVTVLQVDDHTVLVQRVNGVVSIAGHGVHLERNCIRLDHIESSGVFKGLVAMGVLTQADVEEHEEDVRKRREARSRAYQVEEFKRLATALGVKSVDELPAAEEKAE